MYRESCRVEQVLGGLGSGTFALGPVWSLWAGALVWCCGGAMRKMAKRFLASWVGELVASCKDTQEL